MSDCSLDRWTNTDRQTILTCTLKLLDASVIYHMEPESNNRRLKKNWKHLVTVWNVCSLSRVTIVWMCLGAGGNMTALFSDSVSSSSAVYQQRCLQQVPVGRLVQVPACLSISLSLCFLVCLFGCLLLLPISVLCCLCCPFLCQSYFCCLSTFF